MIQLIVNAFVEKEKTGAVVEVLYASSDHEKVKTKYEELVAQYPENYLAIYDVPLGEVFIDIQHRSDFAWCWEYNIIDFFKVFIIHMDMIIFFKAIINRTVVI